MCRFIVVSAALAGRLGDVLFYSCIGYLVGLCVRTLQGGPAKLAKLKLAREANSFAGVLCVLSVYWCTFFWFIGYPYADLK